MTFTTWKYQNFSEDAVSDPLVTGQGIDLDSDTLDTVLEYAFGHDPESHDSHESYRASQVTEENMNYLALTFRRRTSAIDLDYSDTTRTVELVRGELLATVAKAPDRPFQVVTRDLTATALGTEYSVRLDDGFTRVAVQESTVAVTPRDGADGLKLTAGQQADLNRQGVIARADIPRQRPDWADGRLAFSKAPLTEVVERLARHRPGLLTLDDALAAPDAPRFTGVLPADDSDAALALLADTLNLEVRYLTPWYVTVRRRSP